MRKFTKQQIIILLCIVILIAGAIIGLVLGTAQTRSPGQSMDEKTCRYNGIEREANDSFGSIDGCNTCSCNEGRVLCTARACETDVMPTL